MTHSPAALSALERRLLTSGATIAFVAEVFIIPRSEARKLLSSYGAKDCGRNGTWRMPGTLERKSSF